MANAANAVDPLIELLRARHDDVLDAVKDVAGRGAALRASASLYRIDKALSGTAQPRPANELLDEVLTPHAALRDALVARCLARPNGALELPRLLAALDVVLAADIAKTAVLDERAEKRRREEEHEREKYFRERFLAILGHDLRNPLNAITMGAELLLRTPDTPPSSKRVVERIAKGAMRMERLIKDVVDVAATRLGGGLPIEKRTCDLDPICRQVVFEHEMVEPGRVQYAGAVGCRGFWDGDRLAQVVQNLLSNALKHGAPHQPITLRATADAHRTRIEVTNSGAPIPDDLVPHLFDPFRRGRDEHAKGLGLGLFIVAEIARAHGGTVSVQSDETATTFTVELPCDALSAA